jgi:DNA mismatch repair protein MutS
MTAKEYAGKIRFMYQMKEGGSNRSFGVEVAKLTDMPSVVIKKAEKILRDMEKTDRRIRFERGSSLQTDIFSMGSSTQSQTPEHITKAIELIEENNPNNLTPRQALDIIFRVNDIIKNSEGDDR